MQTNNNPVVEIGVILIALGFITAGTTLLALGKIDLNVAMTLYILAASIAGINVAIKAPSPTQQAALLQLTPQALQSQLVQESAPVATPNNSAAMMEQAAQYANALSTPGTAIPPAAVAMPQAIMTTQNMPAVPKQ